MALGKLISMVILAAVALLAVAKQAPAGPDVASMTAHALWEAFTTSFAMIIATELGDKTFFIAALLAMRHDRLLTFLGAASALALMTALGAIVGFMLPNLLPKLYTHWAAVGLFVYFGFKQLREGAEMALKGEGQGASGELEEVEQDLKDKSGKCSAAAVVTQALMMTFCAEWGDRSQIATIALAAAKAPLGVLAGGVVGHCCCTGLAVLGGRVLAARISERVVLMVGGSLFLVFAVHGCISGP